IMIANDLAYRREPQPRSCRARSEKRLEQALCDVLAKAPASIGDGDASIRARLQFSVAEDAGGSKVLRIRRDIDASRFPHRLRRIPAQVDYDLLQLRSLAEYRKAFGRVRDDQLDARRQRRS